MCAFLSLWRPLRTSPTLYLASPSQLSRPLPSWIPLLLPFSVDKSRASTSDPSADAVPMPFPQVPYLPDSAIDANAVPSAQWTLLIFPSSLSHSHSRSHFPRTIPCPVSTMASTFAVATATVVATANEIATATTANAWLSAVLVAVTQRRSPTTRCRSLPSLSRLSFASPSG
eukprot:CAMPEP_0117682130 /NCGR_PEP_ID=MMETSP0804-20121206/19444_1 /TAXON_ID=1074897 /ORGANISM="Tetraselmis astigmatica, Strain CCMP880" /LENGTH=171 /DNA_ID=CAMNT_0005492119 /DNA_START=351 /DNA_END=866 /DNA_ORIENTATION=-